MDSTWGANDVDKNIFVFFTNKNSKYETRARNPGGSVSQYEPQYILTKYTQDAHLKCHFNIYRNMLLHAFLICWHYEKMRYSVGICPRDLCVSICVSAESPGPALFGLSLSSCIEYFVFLLSILLHPLNTPERKESSKPQVKVHELWLHCVIVISNVHMSPRLNLLWLKTKSGTTQYFIFWNLYISHTKNCQIYQIPKLMWCNKDELFHGVNLCMGDTGCMYSYLGSFGHSQEFY